MHRCFVCNAFCPVGKTFCTACAAQLLPVAQDGVEAVVRADIERQMQPIADAIDRSVWGFDAPEPDPEAQAAADRAFMDAVTSAGVPEQLQAIADRECAAALAHVAPLLKAAP